MKLNADAAATIKDPTPIPTTDSTTPSTDDVTYDDEGFERATDGTDY